MAPAGSFYSLELENPLDYGDIIGENNELILAERNIYTFYAQSWILTHYLMSNPELIKKTQEYLNARYDGEDSLKAFIRIFGMDMKTLNKTLKSYVISGMNARSYSFNNELDFHIKIEKMPQSASNMLLLRAAALSCPKKEYQPKLLQNIQQSATKLGDDEYALQTLAIGELMLGDETKAKDYFKNKAYNNDDADSWTYYGQSLLFETQNDKKLNEVEKGKMLKEARAAFQKSYQLNPFNSANLYYLSSIKDDDKIVDENLLNAAWEAYNLKPYVNVYAFNLAYLLIKNNDSQEAKKIIISLNSNPHLRLQKSFLQKIVKAIDDKAPKEDILKMLTE